MSKAFEAFSGMQVILFKHSFAQASVLKSNFTKKIADLADLYYISIAPHDFEGPIAWVSAMHVSTAVTNFFILESCYPRYMTTYPYFFKNIPQPENGYITPPDEPGLGLEFSEEPFKNGDAIVVTIAEL